MAHKETLEQQVTQKLIEYGFDVKDGMLYFADQSEFAETSGESGCTDQSVAETSGDNGCADGQEIEISTAGGLVILETLKTKKMNLL